VVDPAHEPHASLARAVRLGVTTEEIALDRSTCARLDVRVERTDIAVDKVPLLRGSASIDCTVDGVRVAGELQFTGCHRSAEAAEVSASIDRLSPR
jgi:hypothetical protein